MTLKLLALPTAVSALAIAVGSAAATTPPTPRQQVASCMRAKHYTMPPTAAELKNAKFGAALQACLKKAHISAVTAKQLIAYDNCLIKHGIVLGKTPRQSSKYKNARKACKPLLG